MKSLSVIRGADAVLRGNIYRSIDIAASGMTAQRMKMDAISSNIANMSVTNVDGQGNPYLRQNVTMSQNPRKTFEQELRESVDRLKTTRRGQIADPYVVQSRFEVTPLVDGEVAEIPNMKKNVVHDPSHPDADADGFVTYPDINSVEEMVDLMMASRAFDANVTVVNAAKQMILRSLEL